MCCNKVNSKVVYIYTYSSGKVVTSYFHRMVIICFRNEGSHKPAIYKIWIIYLTVCVWRGLCLNADNSIPNINCANAAFYRTIICDGLWCTVTPVTACHQRSGTFFTETCQKLALWAVGHWRMSFTVNINHGAWWISPFSSNLVTNSYRPQWCHGQSAGSCSRMVSVSAADCTAVGLKGSPKPYGRVDRSCWWMNHNNNNLQSVQSVCGVSVLWCHISAAFGF